jgi:hypothetical protein
LVAALAADAVPVESDQDLATPHALALRQLMARRTNQAQLRMLSGKLFLTPSLLAPAY